MKNKILSLLLICTLASLSVMLTGCGEKQENNIQEELNANEENNKIAKIDESKEIVYSVYKENFKSSLDETVTTDIPAFNINTEEIKNLNAEILNKYKPDEADMTIPNTSYKYYENDNIISVIIDRTTTETSYDEYNVYNVDKSTGKQLSKDEVISNKNLEKENYEETILSQMEKICSESYKDVTGADEFIKEANSKTTSKDNCSLEKTKPYIGENGVLHYVIDIYSIAGAEKYEHIINYETGDEENFETMQKDTGNTNTETSNDKNSKELEPNATISKDELIGKWEIRGTDNKNCSTMDIFGSGLKNSSTMEFKEDGTYTICLGLDVVNQKGKYTIDGGRIKISDIQNMSVVDSFNHSEDEYIVRNEDGKIKLYNYEKEADTKSDIYVNLIFEKE